MKKIEQLYSEDSITIQLFGKEASVEVFSVEGNYEVEEDEKWLLTEEELECLNWFIANVKIEDYKQEILAYCNEVYENIGEEPIEEAELEDEISIFAIAVNTSGVVQSKDGFVYPEISFYGDCKCDEEHGICIGFRDKKFLGIHAQDWTL